MDKKTIILIITILILVVAVFIFWGGNGDLISQETEDKTNIISDENLSDVDSSLQNSDSGVLTPYEQKLKALQTMPLTKADSEELLYAGSKEKFKLFKLKVTENGYIPDSIIVEKGDNVQLDIFSERGTDIQSQDFNFYFSIPAKKTVSMGFLTNNEGTFVFYCRDMCLGNERVFGHIVVRPRS
ncbi:MAG: hypothetical protein AB1333_02315 [Patescibacteria group bacterium]